MKKKLKKFLVSILLAVILSAYISVSRADIYGLSGVFYFFMLSLLVLPFAMAFEILFRNLINNINSIKKTIIWSFLFLFSLVVLTLLSLIFLLMI